MDSSDCIVEVSAPSRLHCGLLSVGHTGPRRYGGCGFMIQDPRVVIRARLAGDPQGALADSSPSMPPRLQKVVEALRRRFAQAGWAESQLPPVTLEIHEMPPAHSGFGSGTQLTLAAAVAAQQLWQGTPLSAAELAEILGRGRRSAIGTYGFFSGGFLVDRGLGETDTLSPLAIRTEFPDWPLVLIQFPDLEGLHGIEELRAFDTMVSTSDSERQVMERLLQDSLIPAVYAADFETFAGVLGEYGRRSGEYYREIQGGAYHCPDVANVVGQVMEWGYAGVFQSSWGPTLAVVTRDPTHAEGLIQRLKQKVTANIRVRRTAADNAGMRIRRVDC